jgi:hypothetical protein
MLYFEPSRLHCEHPRLHFKPVKLQNVEFLQLLQNIRILIQIFCLKRIRTQPPQIMRIQIRIRNPARHYCILIRILMGSRFIWVWIRNQNSDMYSIWIQEGKNENHTPRKKA